MADFDTPAGKEYRGPSGIARDSVWLTNEDIPHDRDTVVTIESVQLRQNVKFQGGRTKPNALSLKFVGKSRELALNATNRKTLAALFQTNECAAWFGKRVALFVEQGVRRPDGTTGPAVRIRAKRIEQAAAAQSDAADNPMLTSADEAAAIRAARDE